MDVDRMKMARVILPLLLLVLMAGPVWSQVRLQEGTAVTVAFKQDVSSKHVAPGDEIAIELTNDIEVGGVVLVKAGVEGKATVKSVKAAGKGGSGGKLTVELTELTSNGTSLKTIDNQNIKIEAIDGPVEVKGGGKKILSYLFIFGLFIKGSEAVIPADTQYQAQVAENVFVIPAGG